MPDPIESPKSKPLTPLKLIAYSAAGILVSFGLCGAGGSLGDRFNFLAVAGSVCFSASAVGLILGVLWGIWGSGEP